MYRIPIFLFLLLSFSSSVFSQQIFSPKDGDRIVYLGNSLMENEQQYGFLEYLITSHHPEKQLSFRNLGWSGDTVFGDARSYYTSPPGPFELLIQQIRDVQPNWVILAYGGIEAQSGEKGLPAFAEGLQRLLDSLDQLNTRVILLSALPHRAAGTDNLLGERNASLRLYNEQMAQLEDQEKVFFVNVFDAFYSPESIDCWESNGIHLNEKGYHQLAQLIVSAIHSPVLEQELVLDISSNSVLGGDSLIGLESDRKAGTVSFTRVPNQLRLPLEKNQIQVKGLAKGMYTLTIDGELVAVGSHKQFAAGMALEQGPEVAQGRELLERIREKDRIYFQKYRPQNRTYIIGFRKYEQGRHKEGLDALDTLIYWLEEKINLGKKPVRQQYRIQPVSGD
ncbi:Lysophospholipase L1 [Cyclobacterium xiamenense]|uniref:Lysophospholipase L1 n=1 Tax=Cyclobacterium xiamenense TaxID=1297121 RepID=A0A1H6U958_9BACT|nr:SGNH/GDSL hydrolase family protein [Cyclobacterium xiamenense]SEI87144.1 Lysophospholipase L1 [Cyclobacterium xiamenense]